MTRAEAEWSANIDGVRSTFAGVQQLADALAGELRRDRTRIKKLNHV